ncbi:MAG: hypothetical protein JWM37_512 [Candidatus Saccharibacteria bacterium]|nr:hypothetical protein [Candidatus Saccharibacteria bacterium]
MEELDFDTLFKEMTRSVEEEIQADRERRAKDAWQSEARPVPEGLIREGIPLGHIAFMGDYENPNE